MDINTVQGKWKELKGDLQKTWGRITDDEWEKTKGDMHAVAGLVQQKYGEKKDDISHKVSGLYEKYISQPARESLKSDDSKTSTQSPPDQSKY